VGRSDTDTGIHERERPADLEHAAPAVQDVDSPFDRDVSTMPRRARTGLPDVVEDARVAFHRALAERREHERPVLARTDVKDPLVDGYALAAGTVRGLRAPRRRPARCGRACERGGPEHRTGDERRCRSCCKAISVHCASFPRAGRRRWSRPRGEASTVSTPDCRRVPARCWRPKRLSEPLPGSHGTFRTCRYLRGHALPRRRLLIAGTDRAGRAVARLTSPSTALSP
jgi:hypothetical protein